MESLNSVLEHGRDRSQENRAYSVAMRAQEILIAMVPRCVDEQKLIEAAFRISEGFQKEADQQAIAGREADRVAHRALVKQKLSKIEQE